MLLKVETLAFWKADIVESKSVAKVVWKSMTLQLERPFLYQQPSSLEDNVLDLPATSILCDDRE